jgi:hypothetical protein
MREMQRKFPDGARVDMVNTIVCCAENESLDDCWISHARSMHDFI